MDRETFDVMWKMSEGEAKGCFMRHTTVEYAAKEFVGLDTMPDVGALPGRLVPGDKLNHYTPSHTIQYKALPASELPEGNTYGVSFTTLSIDPTTYLPYLLQRFLSFPLESGHRNDDQNQPKG